MIRLAITGVLLAVAIAVAAHAWPKVSHLLAHIERSVQTTLKEDAR